jgi:amino acid permease
MSQAGMIGGIVLLFVVGIVAWITSIMVARTLNGDPRPLSYFGSGDSFAGGSASSPTTKSLLDLNSLAGSAPSTVRRLVQEPMSSFPDIACVAFGNSVWVFISIVFYFELFAIVTVYAISAGDHLHAIFPTISFNAHMIGIGIASLSAMFLLSTARKISHLSLLGTLATLGVVGAVMTSFFMEGDITDEIAPTVTPPLPAPHHALWRSSGLTYVLSWA